MHYFISNKYDIIDFQLASETTKFVTFARFDFINRKIEFLVS